MKILTALYMMKRGGAYDRFISVVEIILEKGCEVHCLSLSPIQIEHPLFYNHVIKFPSHLLGSTIMKIATIILFPTFSFWICWRKKIQLLLTFSTLYAFLGAFPKWMLRRSMITFIWGDSSFGLKVHRSPKLLIKLSIIMEVIGIYFSDRIITVNFTLQEAIRRRIRKGRDIEVRVLFNDIPPIPASNPVDVKQVRKSLGIEEGSKLITTVGVINQGKNIEVLLRSLPIIGIDYLYLAIVGDGLTKADFQYRDRLKELSKRLKVSSKVIFTGWLEKEKAWKILSASDLFIMPSLNEGMPNAVLEALGLNLPCLGSNIPGIIDILFYSELLFNPRDEKTISNKIHKFFTDRDYMEKLKNLCEERKKIFLFNWKERLFPMIVESIR